MTLWICQQAKCFSSLKEQESKMLQCSLARAQATYIEMRKNTQIVTVAKLRIGKTSRVLPGLQLMTATGKLKSNGRNVKVAENMISLLRNG